MPESPLFPLSIDRDFKAKVPAVTVGCLTANVVVTDHDERLWQEIAVAAARFRGISLDQARQAPPIKALRQVYRTLGNDPTRYRGSNEALVRRITQGKELYSVNTVVDINNLVSLESLRSCGVIDRDRIKPPVVFRIGQPGEAYAGIGRGEIKLARIPVFVDADGPFASTTSDSERAMVTLHTTRLLMLIISFDGQRGLEESLHRSAALLQRYAQAADVLTAIVE